MLNLCFSKPYAATLTYISHNGRWSIIFSIFRIKGPLAPEKRKKRQKEDSQRVWNVFCTLCMWNFMVNLGQLLNTRIRKKNEWEEVEKKSSAYSSETLKVRNRSYGEDESFQVKWWKSNSCEWKFSEFFFFVRQMMM